MRHRKRQFKIGRRPDHVRSLLANQVCSLIVEGRIRTTVTRAKEVRRLAEKMVTLGKRGTLHDRRRAISRLQQVGVVRKLFDEISPRYGGRSGGYTRIIRIGNRRGDAAPLCYLEFIDDGAVLAAAAHSQRSNDASVAAGPSDDTPKAKTAIQALPTDSSEAGAEPTDQGSASQAVDADPSTDAGDSGTTLSDGADGGDKSAGSTDDSKGETDAESGNGKVTG